MKEGRVQLWLGFPMTKDMPVPVSGPCSLPTLGDAPFSPQAGWAWGCGQDLFGLYSLNTQFWHEGNFE